MSFDYPDKPKETKTPPLGATKRIYNAAFVVALLSISFASGLFQRWMGWDIGGFLIGFIMLFSKELAVYACRRAEVSREENRQEIIERSAGAALAPFLSEAPEFDLGHAKRPRTRVDCDSISGYSSGSKWMRIEWRDVGSCIVTTRRDVFGNPSYCHIRLEGHQKFHTLFQSQLSHADAEKLLPAVRFYLRGDESALQVLGGS